LLKNTRITKKTISGGEKGFYLEGGKNVRSRGKGNNSRRGGKEAVIGVTKV